MVSLLVSCRGEVEEKQLGLIQRVDRERRDIGQQGSVSFVQGNAFDDKGAANDLQPSSSTCVDCMLHPLPLLENRCKHRYVLLDLNRLLGAIAGRNESKQAASFIPEELLFVAWFEPTLRGTTQI